MAQTSWKNKEEDKERTDEWRINTEINPGRTETFSDKKTSSVKEQQLLFYPYYYKFWYAEL